MQTAAVELISMHKQIFAYHSKGVHGLPEDCIAEGTIGYHEILTEIDRYTVSVQVKGEFKEVGAHTGLGDHAKSCNFEQMRRH